MLDRMLEALEIKGLKGRGIVTAVAKATGYTTGTVSPVLAGKEEINNRFLRAVCSAYGINEEWVKTGNGEMFAAEKLHLGLADHAMRVLLNRMSPESRRQYERNQKLSIESQIATSTDNTKGTLLTPVVAHTRTVPIISKVQAGDFGYWEDSYPVGEGMDRVECPADVIDPHAFAVRVEGDSMHPRYKQGEVVIVDTTKQVCNGDDVVVKLNDGAVMIKEYKQMHGMVFLKSCNSTYEDIPVLDGDMECCYKIVCRR